jgi:ribose transport system substrate-binding protein
MKKFTLVSILVIFVLIIGACTTPPKPEPTISYPPPKPQISVFQEAQNGKPFRWPHDNSAHPVTRLMLAGFMQACKDFDLLCEDMGIDGDNTPGALALVEQAAALGTSGMLFAIFQPAHYQPTIDAIKAGIPVASFHFAVDKKDVPGLLAFAAPDMGDYSTRAGYAMAEKTNCGSPIGITQSMLNTGENLVTENFRKAYSERCPDAVLLETQMEGLDQAAAIAVASAIIQANSDIKGGFSSTGNGPTTWAKAAQENGKKPGEITIISMDYTRPNLDLVKNGEVYMLVGQPLFEETYYATTLLVLNMMGYPVPYEHYLPAPLITLENVDKYFAINDLAEGIAK